LAAEQEQRKLSAIGALPANLHEAARAEYLAQFVLSAFGSSAPILRTEDHGFDFFCSLTRREGRRLWPDGYYAVQVKSLSGTADPEPWTFSTPDSVKWFTEYPAPLFLCTVYKKTARLQVYQNLVRFGVAVSGELPEQLTLVPGGRGSGASGPYGFDPDTGNYLLGDPVLDFTIPEVLDDDRLNELKRVLKFWVDIDAENIRRYQIGLRTLRAPWQYVTNAMPEGMMKLSMRLTPAPVRQQQELLVTEILGGLVGARLEDNDRIGALLAALQVRLRQAPGEEVVWTEVSDLRRQSRLNTATNTDPNAHDAAPLDVLLDNLARMVEDDAAN
jgi:hypothetical protein